MERVEMDRRAIAWISPAGALRARSVKVQEMNWAPWSHLTLTGAER
jgi:hypothetical protein